MIGCFHKNPVEEGLVFKPEDYSYIKPHDTIVRQRRDYVVPIPNWGLDETSYPRIYIAIPAVPNP